MSQHVLAFPPPFSPSANGPREGGLDTRGNRMGWPNLFRINKVSRGKKKPQKTKKPKNQQTPTPGIVPNTWARDKFNGDVTRPANRAGGARW